MEYDHDSPEGQLRQLADLAFLLQVGTLWIAVVWIGVGVQGLNIVALGGVSVSCSVLSEVLMAGTLDIVVGQPG